MDKGPSLLATAGTGDVLSGILVSLLSQGYSRLEASILGTYLHAEAANYYMNNISKDGMTASDLIDCIPHAFNILRKWLKLGCSSWQVDLDELLVNAAIMHPDLKELLIQNNIESIWRNLQLSSPSENHFTKQFHCWFDGLKTIRLLKHFTKTYNI